MKYEIRALGLNTNKPKEKKMEEKQKRRDGVSRRKEESFVSSVRVMGQISLKGMKAEH